MVVIFQSGCLRAKVVVSGKKRLCSRKSCFNRAKAVILRQSGCIRAKWFYSGKMVVVGQSVGIRAKVVVYGYKKLYSCKSGFVRAIVVVFGQKWLFSDKSGCIRSKWL